MEKCDNCNNNIATVGNFCNECFEIWSDKQWKIIKAKIDKHILKCHKCNAMLIENYRKFKDKLYCDPCYVDNFINCESDENI